MKMVHCSRKVNFMIVEPDAASQIQVEKVLKTQGLMWDLVTGVFDATTGRNENLVTGAIAAVNRLTVRCVVQCSL